MRDRFAKNGIFFMYVDFHLYGWYIIVTMMVNISSAATLT